MESKTFTLTFGSIDGQDGNLHEKVEKVNIQEVSVLEAVRKANTILEEKTNVHHIPFMPQLTDADGKYIALTTPQPPYAHRLTWISGSVVGSKEEWVEIDKI